MSAEGITPQIDLALERERRFARLIDHIDQIDGCDGPDGSVPGVSRAKVVNGICRQHPRYVLACLYGDRGRTFLHLADTLEQLGELASGRVEDAELIVAYYDLDSLAGDEPLIDIGDQVLLLDDDMRTPLEGAMSGVWFVVEHNGTEDDGDGAYRKCDLAREEDGDPVTWHDTDHLRLVERAEPDERLPRRYSVAGVKTVVAFNTIPDAR